MKYVITDLAPRKSGQSVEARRSVFIASFKSLDDAVIAAVAIAKDRTAHIYGGQLDTDAEADSVRSIHVNAEHAGRHAFSVGGWLCRRSDLFDVISAIDKGRAYAKKWKAEKRKEKAQLDFFRSFTTAHKYGSTEYQDLRVLFWEPGPVRTAYATGDYKTAETLLAGAGFEPVRKAKREAVAA